ncbi:MAG: hypothetical protein JST20_08990 [Bacteroidetes bacterium]|nr:hypothetical protein [Bacteroidota bacterium]
MNKKILTLNINLLVGCAVLIIGCGGAESIVTPRKVDVVINKGTPIITDQTANASLRASLNSTNISTKIIPNVSKIMLYSFPDTTFAINVECSIANISTQNTESYRLDSVFFRTGLVPIDGKIINLSGIITSKDSLASKLLFTTQVTSSRKTSDTTFVQKSAFRKDTSDTMLLENLVINRIITNQNVVDDTLRFSFNPFAPPHQFDIRTDTLVRIIKNTITNSDSSIRNIIEPITISNTFYSPTLSAHIDSKNKLITADFVFNTNKEQALTAKFNGQNVQVVISIDIPVP